MKAAVHILLLVTLTYLGESIRMPYYLVEQARTTAAADCRQMKKGQQCPYQHQHSGKGSSHDTKGCCDPMATCSSCPLCYTAEVACAYASTNFSSTIQQHYPEYTDASLADYTASSWKPPNA